MASNLHLLRQVLTARAFTLIDYRQKPIGRHEVEPFLPCHGKEILAAIIAAIAVSPMDEPRFLGLSDYVEGFLQGDFLQQAAGLVEIVVPPGPVKTGKAGHERVIARAPYHPAAARRDDPPLSSFNPQLPVFFFQDILWADVRAALESPRLPAISGGSVPWLR